MWAAGTSGNPQGRPRGTKNTTWRADFEKAIREDKNKYNQSIFEYALEQARKDNTVLVAILKKVIPDLKQVESKVEVSAVGYASMTPAQACEEMDMATLGKREDILSSV